MPFLCVLWPNRFAGSTSVCSLARAETQQGFVSFLGLAHPARTMLLDSFADGLLTQCFGMMMVLSRNLQTLLWTWLRPLLSSCHCFPHAGSLYLSSGFTSMDLGRLHMLCPAQRAVHQVGWSVFPSRCLCPAGPTFLHVAFMHPSYAFPFVSCT